MLLKNIDVWSDGNGWEKAVLFPRPLPFSYTRLRSSRVIGIACQNPDITKHAALYWSAGRRLYLFFVVDLLQNILWFHFSLRDEHLSISYLLSGFLKTYPIISEDYVVLLDLPRPNWRDLAKLMMVSWFDVNSWVERDQGGWVMWAPPATAARLGSIWIHSLLADETFQW